MGLLTIIRKTKERERQLRVLVLYVVWCLFVCLGGTNGNVHDQPMVGSLQRARQCWQDDVRQVPQPRGRDVDQPHAWFLDPNYRAQRVRSSERTSERAIELVSGLTGLQRQLLRSRVGCRRTAIAAHLLAQLL